MKTIIIASGDMTPSQEITSRLKCADLIIAADGGAVHLYHMHLCPHVIIGDMDSIAQDAKFFFEQQKVPFLSHPPRKDQTDMELCVSYAMEQGASDITFIGATGVRLDHTLANILLLNMLKDTGISARVLDAHNEILLVTQRLELDGKPGDLLSLVPVSDQITGITLEGLEYPLKDATIPLGSALGVSNRFTGKKAVIHIASGMALAIRSRD